MSASANAKCTGLGWTFGLACLAPSHMQQGRCRQQEASHERLELILGTPPQQQDSAHQSWAGNTLGAGDVTGGHCSTTCITN